MSLERVLFRPTHGQTRGTDNAYIKPSAHVAARSEHGVIATFGTTFLLFLRWKDDIGARGSGDAETDPGAPGLSQS